MFRIDNDSAVAVMPTITAAGDEGFFTVGDPGGGIEATIVTADFLNILQEELSDLVDYAGLTNDKEDNTQVRQAVLALIAAAAVSNSFPQGHLSGLGISNNGSDASNDIDFAAGSARDSGNTTDITATALTKRLDAAWAAGTNQGGLFGGSKSNSTWYHCFVIKDPVNNLVDCGFSTNASASDRPVAYTKYRRLGAVLTDGSGNILAFTRYGTGNDRETVWTAPAIDTNTSYVHTSRTALAVAAPLGVVTKPSLMYTCDSPSTVGTWCYWTTSTQTDTAPNTTTALAHDTLPTVNGSARHVEIWTNTSSQVYFRPSETVTLRVRTYGYKETL